VSPSGRVAHRSPARSLAAVYTYDAVGNLLSIARQGASAVSIIDFSTGPGTVGSEVTIYGVGFSATPGNNTVTFNGTPAVVTVPVVAPRARSS